MTVQPFACREAFAARPVAPGAAEVPPLRFTVPFDRPAVFRETRMLFTLVWLRAQFSQALVKSVAEQLLNIPAGKDVRLVQLYQAPLKLVPLLTSSRGKEVRLVQLYQAPLKLVPLLTSISGKEVRLVQLYQETPKFVPELTSSSGKEVRLVQLYQVT